MTTDFIEQTEVSIFAIFRGRHHPIRLLGSEYWGPSIAKIQLDILGEEVIRYTGMIDTRGLKETFPLLYRTLHSIELRGWSLLAGLFLTQPATILYFSTTR